MFEAIRRASGGTWFDDALEQAFRGCWRHLERLTALPGRRFLVTSGFRRLQESKIRALGLAQRFPAIYVDAIDEANRLRLDIRDGGI